MTTPLPPSLLGELARAREAWRAHDTAATRAALHAAIDAVLAASRGADDGVLAPPVTSER